MSRTFACGRVLSTVTINGIRFTPREGEFLRMIGNGLTVREISRAMGISYESATVYQCNLRFKAGLKCSIGRRPTGTVSATQELAAWVAAGMKRANRRR